MKTKVKLSRICNQNVNKDEMSPFCSVNMSPSIFSFILDFNSLNCICTSVKGCRTGLVFLCLNEGMVEPIVMFSVLHRTHESFPLCGGGVYAVHNGKGCCGSCAALKV